MYKTLAVFQLPMDWLNADAFINIFLMSVTLAVSHEPMGWLNEDAFEIRESMFVISVVTMLLKGTTFPLYVKYVTPVPDDK